MSLFDVHYKNVDGNERSTTYCCESAKEAENLFLSERECGEEIEYIQKNDGVTVNYLLSMFQNLAHAGYGNMVLKIEDEPVHDDEISIHYLTKELIIRKNLANDSLTKRMEKFCEDVEMARRAFYGHYEDEES